MERYYVGVLAGGLGLAVFFGLGKVLLDFRRWKHDAVKERPPWERGF